MEILLNKKPKNPIIIEGFPGIGFIGSIATEFLVDHLKAEKIGKIEFTEQTPVVAIHNSKVVEPFGIFYSSKYNLVILHAINPVNNNKQDILIEASFGLGEAVVAGEVTPDMYVVHKDNLKIHTKNINSQEWGYFRDQKTGKTLKKNVKNPNAQVLTDKQIKEIASVAKKIELHYNHPQDIEFAFEKNKLYILQSRPITTCSS